MMRRGLASTAMLSLMLVSAVNGAEQEQWQRVLKGKDAKRAEELQKQIDERMAGGEFAEALKPSEELLALRRRVQGDKHWETIDTREERDLLKHLLSQPAARQRGFVTAIKLATEADRLREQSRYAEVEQRYRQVLSILSNVLGEQHPKTIASLDNLAGILTDQGKYAEGERRHRQALDLRLKVLGEQHPHTAISLNNLARNLNAQGKHAQVEPLLRQALDIFRRALGEEHARTATNLNNLAVNLNNQGKYAEAERLHRQALSVRRKLLGEQHVDIAISLHNLADCLNAQGKHAEAETPIRQALAIFRKALGEQHPYTASSLDNLASNLNSQSKHTEAETLHRQALVIFRQTLGEQHPYTVNCFNNLAIALYGQGKYAEAEPLMHQVLTLRRKMLGELHPDIATNLNNLASNLSAQHKYPEAEKLNRQALIIFRQTLGEQHPLTATSLNSLATDLDHQGRYADAEPFFRQALDIRRKKLGDEHPLTAQSFGNLAYNLMDQGKYEEAETLHRRALAIFRKTLSEQHLQTANSLNSLASSLDHQGKYAGAEPLFRQSLAIRHKQLGERHLETTESLNNLASNLHAQGKYKEAAKCWRDAADAFEVVRWNAAASGFDRALFGGKFSDRILAAAGCMARLRQFTDAWRYAEIGLGRGLLDDLTTQTQLLLTKDEQQTLRNHLARLEQLNRLLVPLLTREKLTDAECTRRDQLVKERDDLQAELARQAAERSRREVWSLERIQKQLPADAALVFWIDVKAAPKAADPNGEHWGCIVRQRGEPAWVRLPGSGEKDAWTASDDDLPRRLRDELASGETSWQQHARQMARQRLTPLLPFLNAREGLPGVRRLIAVPAGWMAGIPLEVLSNDYTISYAPSGTVFARLQEQHRKLNQPSLLALGDPNFNLPKDKPSPLPEHGLLLTLVLSGGNASKAGLRDGDVLLSYNNHPLHEFADLKPISSGASVPVQVWRDGKTFETKLPPGQLGVSIDRQPAAEALRRQRDFDALLASRNRDTIAPLPASRYEVQALQPLFAKSTVLLGSDASEQKLDELAAADQLKDYRVLHLATHGEVNLSSAMRSSLLLARDRLPDVSEQARRGAKIYDGHLRAATMAASWRLDADLVTLSACQTALGPSGGGEGLLGFSQVLFRKGARGLLLSLWKVDDTATALLMTRFYENWLGQRKGLKEPLPKAAALREAKQWLRNLHRTERDRLAVNLAAGELRGTVVAAKPVSEAPKEAADTPYSHPRYWAAFIIIGDPE